MTVAPVNGTRPSDFKMVTKIFQGTTQIPSYTRTSPIDLGPGQDYTSLPGILTFRGNNYRDTASYGHFGRSGDGFTWEKTNRAGDLA